MLTASPLASAAELGEWGGYSPTYVTLGGAFGRFPPRRPAHGAPWQDHLVTDDAPTRPDPLAADPVVGAPEPAVSDPAAPAAASDAADPVVVSYAAHRDRVHAVARAIHADPETAFEEHRAHDRSADLLEEIGRAHV